MDLCGQIFPHLHKERLKLGIIFQTILYKTADVYSTIYSQTLNAAFVPDTSVHWRFNDEKEENFMLL